MTMISARRSLLAAVLLAASVPASNAVGGVHLAETTAKTRLDGLFAKLKGAATEAEARQVEGAIWQAWIHTDDGDVAQVMSRVQFAMRAGMYDLALGELDKVVQIAPPAGTRFDPHQHQAISVVPADQEANTVVTVLQKGYLIADRILRPALVTVAAPK